jgi:hypothetical protein
MEVMSRLCVVLVVAPGHAASMLLQLRSNPWTHFS